MSWLVEYRTRFAAAALLAAPAAGCGHPPLTAYATPQPIMLGPVRRLPGGEPATEKDAGDVQAGRFSATATSRVEVTSTPTPGGAYTRTTTVNSLSSALDAAAADAIQGDARGRLEAREVDCSSVVMYAFFYLFAEEQCTLSGRTERPRPSPEATPAGASVPEVASTGATDAAPE